MPQQFKAEPSTLKRLILQSGQGFYIPMYQRDFIWGKAEIARLFEDVDFGLTRAATGQSPSTFLGSVILVEDPHGVEPKNADALPAQVLHVVDGQQRLTTVLILFAVLARTLAEHLTTVESAVAAAGSSPDPIAQWVINSLRTAMESLQDAISIDSYIGTDEFRRKPRLIRQSSDKWGNDSAAAVYESDVAWFLMETIRNRHTDCASTRVSPPATRAHLDDVVRVLEEGIDDIRTGETDCEVLNDLTFLANVSVTEALVGSTAEPMTTPTSLDPTYQASLRLVTAAMFLLSGVLVIDVRAPDEDHAFALFEPLNTTGQLLTALETLKPLVVQAEGGSSSYAVTPAGTDFSRLEGYFPPELKADEKSKRISEFIIAFALGETGTRVSRNLLDQRQYLRSEFRRLAGVNNSLTEQRAFVYHLAESATFMFAVWRADNPAFFAGASNFDWLSLEVLKNTNHTIVIPLLSRYYLQWVSNETQANRAEFFQVLRAVTVFWVLWRTSRATTKGIDDIHRKLMLRGAIGQSPLTPLARRAPNGASTIPSAAALKAALRSLLATRGQISGKSDWTTRATAQPLYQTSKNLAKFLLLAAHEDFIDDSNVPGLPQRGVTGTFLCLRRDAWSSQDSVEHIAPQSPAPGDTSYEQEIYDQGLVDRLGNLTLMPSDLNTLVGNRSWPFKRGIYDILSQTDPQQRLTRLNAAVPGLAAVTRQIVLSAEYLPLVRSLSKSTTQQLTANFLNQRGERLANLVWDILWPHLA